MNNEIEAITIAIQALYASLTEEQQTSVTNYVYQNYTHHDNQVLTKQGIAALEVLRGW